MVWNIFAVVGVFIVIRENMAGKQIQDGPAAERKTGCLIRAGRSQTTTPAESALTPSLRWPTLLVCFLTAAPGPAPENTPPVCLQCAIAPAITKYPALNSRQLSGKPRGRERTVDTICVFDTII